MKASRVSRLLLVTFLFGTALGLSQQSAEATGSTPQLIYGNVLARLVDVDASNNGLIAYTVAQPPSGAGQYTSKVKRTVDGGLDWADLPNSPNGSWTAISTSANGQTVAVIGNVAASTPRLFVSTDSGDTWSQKGPTTTAYLDVAVSGDGSKIVVAQDTDGVSYSTDGGDTWTQSDSDATTAGIQPLLADDIAVNADGTIIAISRSGTSVWRSTTGGNTWNDLQLTKTWRDISISDDGRTVFGVALADKGYIWDGHASPPTWINTSDLGFVNPHDVRGVVSPDGNTFMATSYSAEPRILRNWDRSAAAASAQWPSIIANTSVTAFYVAQVLGMSVTNGGERFIVVNEARGIQARVPETPAPVLTDVSGTCGNSLGGFTTGGALLTFQGRFLYDPIVTIGGVSATVNPVQLPTVFTVDVPAGVAGTADIVVTTPGGSATVGGGFTYRGLSQVWNPIGSAIAGGQLELSGHSIAASHDGETIALGAIAANAARGLARVFDWDGSVWQQRGLDIDGLVGGDEFGESIAMSADGNVVAIGASSANADAGQVRVFAWNGTTWAQRGLSINGNTGAKAGRSVALSDDGNILAIGAPNDFASRGRARIYVWNQSAWAQRGLDIEGDTGDLFGSSIALSGDGSTVAIGAPTRNNSSGRAVAYHWNETSWLPRGNPLDGSAGDLLGISVTLNSDGTVLAVGAPLFDSQRGRVLVQEWNGSAWVQRASAIVGDQGDRAGSSLDLSGDGNVIAYGAPFRCVSGSRGTVVVSDWHANQWVRRSDDISSANGNAIGSKVALSDDGMKVVSADSFANVYQGAVFAWRYTGPLPSPVVDTPPVFVSPPSSSAPSTSTPGTSTAPTPVEPPSVESRDALPVGDPAALFGRSAPADGALPLRVGEQLNVTLDDFTPNEDVWIGLFSDPVTIATVKADARGVVSTTFALPSGITGDHTLVIYGTESGNGVRIPVQLTAPTLPVTGPNTNGSPGLLSVLATLILTLGLTLVIWVYKRTPGVLSQTQNAEG